MLIGDGVPLRTLSDDRRFAPIGARCSASRMPRRSLPASTRQRRYRYADDPEHGRTPVRPLIALSNIAQASAVVGIIISSRKHNERGSFCRHFRLPWGNRTGDVRYQSEVSFSDAVRDDRIWSGISAIRARRHRQRYRRGRPAGHPVYTAARYWRVYGMAMVIAIVIPVIHRRNIYQRKRQGTLQIVWVFFFGAQLRPSALQETTMTIPHWWQNGVIYQICESFQDTTGSGTGGIYAASRSTLISTATRRRCHLAHAVFISRRRWITVMTSPNYTRPSTRPTARWMMILTEAGRAGESTRYSHHHGYGV